MHGNYNIYSAMMCLILDVLRMKSAVSVYISLHTSSPHIHISTFDHLISDSNWILPDLRKFPMASPNMSHSKGCEVNVTKNVTKFEDIPWNWT